MPKDETFVVKRRDYSDVVQLQDRDALEAFIMEPRNFVMDVLIGLMAQGKAGALVSGARIAHGALKAQLFKQFAEEILRLREAGKLPDEISDNKYGYQTWVDLLQIIDQESPDADKLEALKAMFFDVNRINSSDTERIAAYQLWQITKSLPSGELLILKAAYECKDRFGSGNDRYYEWQQLISTKCGGLPSALVDHYEQKLVDMHLLTPRLPSASDKVFPSNARLTDFGMRLCRNIETYQTVIRSCVD